MKTPEVDPVEQFRKLLGRAARTSDPFRRHDLYAAALNAVPAVQAALRMERQAALQQAQAENPDMSYDDIGRRLNPPLDRTRVWHVVAGNTRTGNARQRTAAEVVTTEAAPAAGRKGQQRGRRST